jgi:hypothetical protein
MEIISEVISATLQSFDFGYCLVVNIITYLTIHILMDTPFDMKLTKWRKRIVLICAIILMAGIYKTAGQDIRLIVNSAILAPVSWSWIFKPICKKFNIDYTSIKI